MNNNIKITWKNLIHKMEVNLNTNLHFQFVYYLVLGLKISSHASRAQKASIIKSRAHDQWERKRYGQDIGGKIGGIFGKENTSL